MKLFIAALFILVFLGCTKEGEQRHCWQIIDALGNHLTEICNKTETELLNCTNCGVYNGSAPGTPLKDMIDSCEYYNADDSSYCWSLGNGQFISHEPEKLMNCFFPGVPRVKVACDSWQLWFTRKQYTYKPTNQITYSFISRYNYSNKDTLALFNSPAQIILVNTADSLIILQRSSTGTNFY
jgi:hypothetical protein